MYIGEVISSPFLKPLKSFTTVEKMIGNNGYTEKKV